MICIIVLGFVAYLIDGVRLRHEKPPLLSIKVKETESSKTYLGLGYKVYYSENSHGAILYIWDFFEDLEPPQIYNSDNVIYYVNYK